MSHECDYPPEVQALPRVTRTRVDPALPAREIDRQMAEAKRSGVAPIEVDLPTLARLRPEVLIGQSVCDVCAVGIDELARVVRALDPTPWVVTLHPHTLADVFGDIVRVGESMARKRHRRPRRDPENATQSRAQNSLSRCDPRHRACTIQSRLISRGCWRRRPVSPTDPAAP